jgi:hypothetical protein
MPTPAREKLIRSVMGKYPPLTMERGRSRDGRLPLRANLERYEAEAVWTANRAARRARIPARLAVDERASSPRDRLRRRRRRRVGTSGVPLASRQSESPTLERKAARPCIAFGAAPDVCQKPWSRPRTQPGWDLRSAATSARQRLFAAHAAKTMPATNTAWRSKPRLYGLRIHHPPGPDSVALHSTGGKVAPPAGARTLRGGRLMAAPSVWWSILHRRRVSAGAGSPGGCGLQ